jgi:hypothetical protein
MSDQEKENLYPIVNNYLMFEEVTSDAVGVNFRAGEINPQERKAEKHFMLTEVYPFLYKNQSVWKKVNILLEGVKKSNIPKLYSPEKIVQEEGKTYLLYPLLKGKSFEQVLEDSSKKDLPINFDLAFSIAFAIADLIDIGSSIVVSGEKSFHGFLTPDNIIIDYDGKILLKNYGIYPYLSREEEIYTEIEKKYGAWVAPEFLRKEKLVSQTDIYHLGYILYRILTGKYFSCGQDEDFESKFSNISFTQHIPSSDKEFLTNIILFFKKTLNPVPAERFANIKEFKDFISSRFHIEELSSVTFNLAYFMNSLYLESMEDENKQLAKELEYVIPEEKKEEPQAPAGKGDEHLVEDILTGLDEQKKSKTKIIIPLLIAIAIVVAASSYIIVNQQKQVKEQQLKQVETKEDLKRVQQDLAQFKSQLEKDYQNKLKNIEQKAATTEDEKKEQENEIKKLKEWQKEQMRKALEKKKLEEEAEQKKLDAEAEKKRIEEEKQRQRKLEEQKKLEEEKKKQKAALKKQIVEAQKVEEGQLIAITEVTERPEKIKGKMPVFSPILKRKYKGRNMTVRTILLVDETGSVNEVKMLKKTPTDIKNTVTKALAKWKYNPAKKDGVKVKVWVPVEVNINF